MEVEEDSEEITSLLTLYKQRREEKTIELSRKSIQISLLTFSRPRGWHKGEHSNTWRKAIAYALRPPIDLHYLSCARNIPCTYYDSINIEILGLIFLLIGG